MTLYSLIMAGGTGSRLWPRSRILFPKQFLDITGELTMFQQSYQRIQPLVDPEHILVATNQEYIEIVANQLPTLPNENILGEPRGRGTAAAIGLGAIHIHRRDSEAVMIVLPSDHMVKKTRVFRKVIKSASQVAQEDWLVTLGIMPKYPETGYGYIELEEVLTTINGFDVCSVARFVEKPDLCQAKDYLKCGKYAWNSGMFIWKVNRILEEMARHMPQLYEGLLEIERSIGTPKFDEVLAQVFTGLPNRTIDHGIMEKAAKVAVLPVDIGWNDVGSWAAFYDILPRNLANNVVIGRHLPLDTKNSLIYSPRRMVATIGLEDIVIVDTDDVLLVCHRSRAQDVRKLVDMLKSDGDSHI